MDKLTSWKSGLTPGQMREVDRLAEADYGITPLQLMEVAGLQAARVARIILGPSLAGRAVSILAGKGNNGADGLVAARRLAGWGAAVTVLTSYAPEAATELSAVQLRAAVACGVEVRGWRQPQGRQPAGDLCIDALLGFGASGAPRGVVAEMIESLDHGSTPVLALDLPSGLDGETGDVAGACVVAGTTVTLAAPKTGLLVEGAAARVGTLYVADIGIPPGVLRQVGVDPTGLFQEGDLVRI